MNDIYQILKKYYGYDSFRDGQEEIIKNIISGRDVSAVMPTGSGKSLCYQIPALSSEGITLVVSPLISLMQDQVRSLISMGVRAAYLNSSLTPKQMELAINNAKNGVYKIIYVAPERLLTESFIDFASNADIFMLAVDEAHCISQWGHDFRPSYKKISQFIELLPQRPIVCAFTATATDMVKKDIVKSLKLKNPFTITTGFDRKNLYFGIYKPLDKVQFIMDYISKKSESSGIIYCSTRKDVESVAKTLTDNGFPALPYHGGMNDSERAFNQNEFIYDRTKLIVATNAFGMGIDKPDVRFVIHYSLPQNMEEYYQQAGRAGRDGESAECLLLYYYPDVMVNEFLIKKGSDKEEMSAEEKSRYIASELEKLKLMQFYATSKNICLRKRILTYFGETFKPPCCNCSVCNNDGAEKYYGKSKVAGRIISANSKSFTSVPENKNLFSDEALFARLKKERDHIANMEGIPSYSVADFSAIMEMSIIKPRDIKALSKIKGLGEAKIQRYGQEFLKVINKYEEEADF